MVAKEMQTYRHMHVDRQTDRQRDTGGTVEHGPHAVAILQLKVIAFIAIHLPLPTVVNPRIAVAAAYPLT